MFRAVLLLLLPSLIAVRSEVPDFPMTWSDMKVKAGYYTEDGKYLGGLPKADDLSREIYECLLYQNVSGVTNSTVCMEWRADESAGGEFQVGSCECKFVTGGAYCSAWTCNQVTTETYGVGVVDANIDAVLCLCDIENSSGLFCDAWSCKQIDSEGRVEFEEYDCLRESASGHYCEAWNGNVTAQDEIEVVACQCIAEWQGNGTCSYWECEELGLKTCASSKISWCDLGVSVGVGGGLGFIGVVALCVSFFACRDGVFKENGACQATVYLGFLGIVWGLIWAVPVVIWGGEDGAKYVGIMWGVPIVFTVFTLVSLAACRTCSAVDWKLPSFKGKHDSRGTSITSTSPISDGEYGDSPDQVPH